jgi:hypothetical protein
MGRKVLSSVKSAGPAPAAPVASASPAVAEAMQRARAEVAARDAKATQEVNQMAATAIATLPKVVAVSDKSPVQATLDVGPRAPATRSASDVPVSTQPAAAPATVALQGGADTMAARILAALELTAKTQADMTRIMADAVKMQAETVQLLSAMRELAITSAPAPATSAPAPVAPVVQGTPGGAGMQALTGQRITARDAQGRILPRTAATPAPAPAAPAPKSVKAAEKAATTPKSTTGGATKAREAMAELQALRTRLVAPGKITALDAIIAAVNAGQITDAQIAAADVSVEGIAGDVVAGVCAKITRIAKIK